MLKVYRYIFVCIINKTINNNIQITKRLYINYKNLFNYNINFINNTFKIKITQYSIFNCRKLSFKRI